MNIITVIFESFAVCWTLTGTDKLFDSGDKYEPINGLL